MNSNERCVIDASLVDHLIAVQFPQWQNLPVRVVANGGWDNRTFRLGDNMLVRMPSGANYAVQVAKEQYWLPKLAPFLPLLIPTPLAIGQPGEGYPWRWSVYRWLEGEPAAFAQVNNWRDFAVSLARFLAALQSIDATNGPAAGIHSFYRGGSLTHYDKDTRQAIDQLKDRIDVDVATRTWEAALATQWQDAPVWIHGDISAGNLLVQNGQLSAVIDFGQLAVGDPACDLVIAWTLFSGERRTAFRDILSLDADTWVRAKGWVLWKALITAAGLTNPNNFEAQRCWRIIDEILRDD
ncbi:MAG: aminoglycoside phosphotransferase family protein [Proteobacteria bacterium]|nr:aminoglycoside phosphotransferase family protein [Pseudomonadota bacterium]